MEKLSFSELKIEKVKFFTQSSTKISCIRVLNLSLENLLNFQTIFSVKRLATWLLTKKGVCLVSL